MLTFYRISQPFSGRSGLRPLRFKGPWEPNFTKEAKFMGAEWDSERREWSFPEPEGKVRDLIRTFYGYCPPDPPQFVSCIVNASSQKRKGMFIQFGRVIASRGLWNQPVCIHETCRLLSGSFDQTNEDQEKRLGTNQVRILVRDVPISLTQDPEFPIERIIHDDLNNEQEAYMKQAMFDLQTNMVLLQQKLKEIASIS